MFELNFIGKSTPSLMKQNEIERKRNSTQTDWDEKREKYIHILSRLLAFNEKIKFDGVDDDDNIIMIRKKSTYFNFSLKVVFLVTLHTHLTKHLEDYFHNIFFPFLCTKFIIFFFLEHNENNCKTTTYTTQLCCHKNNMASLLNWWKFFENKHVLSVSEVIRHRKKKCRVQTTVIGNKCITIFFFKCWSKYLNPHTMHLLCVVFMSVASPIGPAWPIQNKDGIKKERRQRRKWGTK